ncbi:CPBP family intramembrane glutamic endopeptidase [Guptibacillus hwajinpoensis]|uniref:Membrane protease YdiL (CAAX protease family) n=1 Tax=Guptibacillus hwajinpoensis TaxID=208199 RepID=A0ABU0K1T4_9BACL|nr:CPBP family intramembrane glutamic endopeptidase [Alkalihalobacillus hemicentroti]MDQ0483239.1 membrane protease YdiL (CAAX protease family) [Alkalihalobacillus hemicentroti]
MNQKIILLSSLLLAHSLLFISFVHYPEMFWPVFTITLSILIFISITTGTFVFKKITLTDTVYIVASALFLYLLSYVGIQLIQWLTPSLFEDMEQFYDIVQPVKAWHYISLVLIVIPGEEIYWRGYIQQQFKKYKNGDTIIIATLLYAVAHLYSGAPLLIVAALVGGVIWGWIYEKRANFWVPLLSHILFDLLILVFIPLL